MEFKKLQQVCTEIIDCPHSTPEWKNAGIPVIRNYNLNNGAIDKSNLSFVDENTYFQRTKRGTPQAGDIIFSREAPVGSVAIIPNDFKCCLGQRLVLLKVDRSVCDPHYLLYVMLSDFVKKQYRTIEKTGSIVSNFNIGDLKNLVIPYVDIKLQEKIGRMCGILDQKIAVNNNAIYSLESMAKTIYDYWFVQFDFPDANGRPYKTSGGKMVWNEELGRDIPEGWEVDLLSNEVDVIDCLHSKKPDYCLQNTENYLLQLDNLVDNGLIDTTNKYYVTQDDYNLWTSKIEVQEGDILITNAGRVGAVYRVPANCKSGIGRNITALHPSKVPPIFLYYYLISSDAEQQIRQNTDLGAFFKSLNVKGIKVLKILKPENGILSSFNEKANSMRSKIELAHEENMQLIKLRDFLLPMLMNGQVGFKET